VSKYKLKTFSQHGKRLFLNQTIDEPSIKELKNLVHDKKRPN
jgi:hypothetical protein